MEGIVFHTAGLQCLFQMLVYRLMVEWAAKAIGEHQIKGIIPQLASEQPLLLLLAVLLPQDADSACGEYNAPLFVFFWRGEIVVECTAFVLLLQLLPNDDAVFLPQDIIPAQAENFRLPQAGKDIKEKDVVKLVVFNRFQETGQLRRSDRLCPALRYTRQGAFVGDVADNDLVTLGGGQ